jgi:hypothetical protein
MTSWYSTWGTNNTAIATATMNKIHGVAAGSTRDFAQGDITWGTGQETRHCPIRFDNAFGDTNVCDFTITPANVLAQNCTGSSQNSNNFTTMGASRTRISRVPLPALLAPDTQMPSSNGLLTQCPWLT